MRFMIIVKAAPETLTKTFFSPSFGMVANPFGVLGMLIVPTM